MLLTQPFQVLIVMVVSFQLTHGDNILFLALPYYGHINPMVKVAEELTKYGHNSYITIPEDFNTKLSPVKEGVNFVIVEDFPEYKIFTDLVLEVLQFPENNRLKESFGALNKLCDRYLVNEELFSKLKSINASLAVVDANFVSNSLAVIAYRLNIPFILQGLHNQINIHRTPWAISVLPHFSIGQAQVTSFPMKLRNAWAHFQDYVNPAPGSPGRSVKYYAPERPDISFDELLQQTEIYIIDSDHFLHVPLPALPHVKYIGGIASRPAEPLEGEILEFVEASKNGVVVVSPGSLVSWHGDHVNKLEEAFGKIKYDVIWKHPDSSYTRPNVLLTKWLPQNNLLGHPNTKLFITHCGNSAQYEGLYHAVPMLGFPVFSDQLFNGRNIQIKGFGISMNLNSSTVEEIVRNIEEVIEHPKYKRNIAKTSEIFRSQKELPSERAARYVNEVLKYGSDHLKSDVLDIPLHEFLMLDIWALVFTVGFVILTLIGFLLRKCLSVVCGRPKTKTE